MATLKITQKKSRIGATERQRRNLDALGLRKVNQSVEHQDSPVILGMIEKVRHLVVIETVKDAKPKKEEPKKTEEPKAENAEKPVAEKKVPAAKKEAAPKAEKPAAEKKAPAKPKAEKKEETAE